MTLATNFFASALRREIDRQKLDLGTIATKLGYASDHTVQMWLAGRSLPQLPNLVELAHQIATPLEDLLFCWLGDHDPKHVADFWIIADLLNGEGVANRMFGGDGDNGEPTDPGT
ncbi:MAG TPA: hypothetical protein VGL58_08515 [Caulobacteraceae bacterium]|jgi:hypothetical protein